MLRNLKVWLWVNYCKEGLGTIKQGQVRGTCEAADVMPCGFQEVVADKMDKSVYQSEHGNFSWFGVNPIYSIWSYSCNYTNQSNKCVLKQSPQNELFTPIWVMFVQIYSA